MRARAGGALVALLIAGCGPGADLVIQVRAEAEVVSQRTQQVVVRVLDAAEPTSVEVPLDGVAPRCLPFSFAVHSDQADVPLSLEVEGRTHDGQAFLQRVDTTMPAGTNFVDIALPAACVDGGCSGPASATPEPAQPEALEARLTQQACGAPITDLACLEAGGCFALEAHGVLACATPCPSTSTVAAPAPPAPPRAPSAARLTPCPEGWDEVAGAPPRCAPWTPEPACPAGSVAFPGDRACAPPSGRCSGDEWGGVITAIFVRPGAVGGDGTRARPYGTLQEALRTARGGATIALSTGTHVTNLEQLRSAIVVVGACATTTRLIGPRGAALTLLEGASLGSLTFAGELRTAGTGHTLAGVTVEGALWVEAQADLHIERLTASDTIRVEGTLEADGVATARGLTVLGSGHLVAARVLLSGQGGLTVDGVAEASALFSTGPELLVRGSGRLTLSDAVLAGAPVRVTPDASLDAERVWVHDVSGAAITVEGQATLRDTVTEELTTHGVYVPDGGALGIDRMVVRRAGLSGLRFAGTSTGTIRDLVVEDMRPTTDSSGEGLELWELAQVSVHRLHVRAAARNAISVSSRRPIVLEDVVVEDTAPQAFGPPVRGRALGIGSAGQVTLRRARLSRNLYEAIRISADNDDDTRLTLEDLVIEDTREAEGGDPARAALSFGSGSAGGEGPTVEVLRAHLRNDSGAEVYMGAGTLRLTDVRLSGTTSSLYDPLLQGHGLAVFGASTVEATRVLVEATASHGVVFEGAAIEASLGDLEVRGTWTPTTSLTLAGGGLQVRGGASVTAQSILLHRHATVGIDVLDGEVDLRDGAVRDNALGARVGPGYDLRRLANEVHYSGNVVRVEVRQR